MTRAELVERMACGICPTFYVTPWEQTTEFGQGLCRDMATAALAAIEAAGFVCVPREATLGMVQAATDRNSTLDGETLYHGIYRAMLAASSLAQEPNDAE